MSQVAAWFRALVHPLIFKPNLKYRKPGVSALVGVRDELFLKQSLLSVRGLVDEFIIVDGGRHSCKKEVEQLREKGLNIIYIRSKPNPGQQWLTACKASSYWWLLRWDADFLAHPKLLELRPRLKELMDDYYFFTYPLVNVCGNFFNITGLHKEHYLFTYSPVFLVNHKTLYRKLHNLKNIMRGRPRIRINHNPIPLFYNKIDIMEPLGIHLDIKKSYRARERHTQTVFGLLSDKEKNNFGGNMENYTETEQEKELTAAGKVKVWIAQLQTYLSILTTTGVIYLVVNENEYLVWEHAALLVGVAIPVVLYFHMKYIFPAALAYQFKKNPELMAMKKDIQDIKQVVLNK